MQFAILAQSPREMSKTDRTTRGTFCHEFASQFGLELFVYAKKLQTSHPLTDRPGRMLQRHQPSERRNLKGSLYGFTPGGDLRPRRLWMILLAPQNHPSLRKSYPRCNDPAKRGSVCEAFEKKPLPLALTRLLRYRYPSYWAKIVSGNRSIDWANGERVGQLGDPGKLK